MSSSPAFSKTNSIISGGKVLNSSIDMNTKVIINAGTPIAGTDVVNKTYCDLNSAKELPTSIVGLSGQTWATILPNTTGAFDIFIVNVILDGPCAKFTLIKNTSTREASVNRWSSIASDDGNVRLQMRWEISGGIQLRKTGNTYDGNYKIIYVSLT